MIDDRDVRTFLSRMAGEIATPGIDPTPVVQRARRRRTRNVAAAIALAALLVPTAVTSLGRLVRANVPTPARPTPTVSMPSPTDDAPVPLVVPDVVPVDVPSRRATTLRVRIPATMDAHDFAVSRDGTQLAFDDGARIYVVGVDGTGMRPVTDVDDATAPSWSPDGRKIVYVDGARSELRVLDLSTGTATSLLRRNPIFRPSFSPDGQRILFTAQRTDGGPLTLWTVPVEGGAPTALPVGPAAFGVYSPDGSTIAYRETQYVGSDPTEMTHNVIWLTDENGSSHRALNPSGFWMSQIDGLRLWPAWSPDGRMIAYEPGNAQDVRVVEVATGRLTRIGPGHRPVWLDEDTLLIEQYARSS